MEQIKDTIKSVIGGLVEKRALPGSDPELLLKNALTKKELKHIKCSNFRKGILSVNVDSSSWLYAVSLKKEALLKTVQAGCSAVKEIHFRIGEV